jgi:hypothetical protein
VSRPLSLLRRAMLTFARVGLDIRPSARRFRDAMLRSHRAETARLFSRVEKTQFHLQVDVAALRGLLQAEVAALHDRYDLLEKSIATAKADSAAPSGVLEEVDARGVGIRS